MAVILTGDRRVGRLRRQAQVQKSISTTIVNRPEEMNGSVEERGQQIIVEQLGVDEAEV